jgi:hypothetical protein
VIAVIRAISFLTANSAQLLRLGNAVVEFANSRNTNFRLQRYWDIECLPYGKPAFAPAPVQPYERCRYDNELRGL